MNENNPAPGNERDALLREENELLRLKIIAQFGGIPAELSGVPPDIANEFLKNVLAFEENFSHSVFTPQKVSMILGDPLFKKSAELNDEAFEDEWKRLQQLLKEKNISVDFIRPRDERFQYTFITEELFGQETNGASMPGMVCHFIYEEFHPDHRQEMTDRMMEFLKAWFERSTESMAYSLASQFIQPDASILSRNTLLNKVQLIFDAYQGFQNCQYQVFEVKFELKEEEQLQGIGHVAGMVKYDVCLESGDIQSFEGPFKFYMSREMDWWSIFYFVMPGFIETVS